MCLFFFLLMDSCFLHNFSKEYRLPFREEGSLLAPQQERERWRKGWIFGSSIGNDSSYVLIQKTSNKQARKTTKTKPNNNNNKKAAKDIQTLSFFSLSFLPSGCPNVPACCKFNCYYST
ncbi:hypothetical protein Nmel_010530 [Mimus melanotis]